MQWNRSTCNQKAISERARSVRRHVLWLAVCCTLLIGASQTHAAEAPTVQLAEAGNAALPITLVDPAGDLPEVFLMEGSLNDLQSTLDQITGATFERKSVDSVTADASPAIYVGLAKHMEHLGVPQDLKPQEGYIGTTEDGSLVLSGAASRGVSHAIYRMLHHLGCRWYYPGEEWAVIPTQRDLSVSFDTRERPDFWIQRRIWIGHGLHGRARPILKDWQRRNCVAEPFDVATSHTWFGLNREEDFKAHPEWFAEVDGKRQPSKPAYAHPEVIQQGIDSAVKFFNENPDRKMVTMSPPDGLGYDTSAQAKEQAGVVRTEKAHGTTFGWQEDGTYVSIASENIFHFINEVARAVQREHPGKMVGILAYSAYAHPPSFDIEPNVYVELTRGYRRTPLSSVEQIMAFSEKADNLGIYEYYDVEQWSWERPGRARAANLNYLQGSTKFYRRYNMTALSGEMSSNFGPYGVGYYVISQLLWDATRDAREIEREFYERAFGPAADPIQRVYRRWESRRGLGEMALAATYRDLAEAHRLTEGEPVYRKRVNRIKMMAHFYKLYLQPKAHGTEEDDVKAWIERYGEEEAKQRVKALGEWVHRLKATHLVHTQAFNKYFQRRGEVLGIDTSGWTGDGEVPSEQEIESIFQQDLQDLADVEVKPIPAAVYSQRLQSVGALNANVPGIENVEAGSTSNMRECTVILKLDANETAQLTLGGAGASYVITSLPADDFESGMGARFAAPFDEGTTESETLEFQSKEAGYYFVRFTGGRPALQAISHPHALPQGSLEMTQGRLFFYVPEGTQHFVLEAGAHKGPTITLRDPSGKTIVQQDGFAVTKQDTDPSTLQTRWIIDVPDGAAGGVWSVEGPGDVNAVSAPSLTGVPPYFAIDPKQLLVPDEVLPAGR